MNLVIDANVLFASLISAGKTAEILINPNFKFFIPGFILKEFEEYTAEILVKTHRTEQEFKDILGVIKEIATLIPEDDIKNNIEEAEKISPDPDDISYFALALKLNCSIWSNDKKLKQQDKIKIYNTEELVKEFNL